MGYRSAGEHGLEFLLAFDGRVHHLEDGYWINLIVDFFDEVERVLRERGISTTVVKVEEKRRQK